MKFTSVVLLLLSLGFVGCGSSVRDDHAEKLDPVLNSKIEGFWRSTGLTNPDGTNTPAARERGNVTEFRGGIQNELYFPENNGISPKLAVALWHSYRSYSFDNGLLVDFETKFPENSISFEILELDDKILRLKSRGKRSAGMIWNYVRLTKEETDKIVNDFNQRDKTILESATFSSTMKVVGANLRQLKEDSERLKKEAPPKWSYNVLDLSGPFTSAEPLAGAVTFSGVPKLITPDPKGCKANLSCYTLEGKLSIQFRVDSTMGLSAFDECEPFIKEIMSHGVDLSFENLLVYPLDNKNHDSRRILGSIKTSKVHVKVSE